MTLEDGRGTPIARTLVHEDALGLFNGEIPVPTVLAPGIGHVVVQADGRDSSGEVWLRDPPTPTSPPRCTSRRTGRMRRWTCATAWVMGWVAPWSGGGFRTPLSPAQGLGDLSPQPASEELAAGNLPIDADGHVQLSLAPNPPDARFSLEVVAIDGWGHRAVAQDEG